MKKYLTIILATLLTISVFTGCAGRSSLPEQSNVSTTNSPIATSEPEEMPDNSFSKEEYQKLLHLRFNGYEDMTVSDYQNRVWELRDTNDYDNLLERFSQSDTLYELKDTNEIAAFVFYILTPLTAEKWQTRDFGGYAMTDYPNVSDNAMLEFSYTLTIKNADALTVREYNTTRLETLNGLQKILHDKTSEQLQSETFMKEQISAEIETLTRKLSTDKLQISVEYSYLPLSEMNENIHNQQSTQAENTNREYPNGTEEDYNSLLALKTPDYQNMNVSDFNLLLLEWANNNYDKMERIYEDILCNDFQVTLSDDDILFVKWAVYLSGKENAKYIQSQHNGRIEETPVCAEQLPTKEIEANGISAWCDLYYQFSYSITDKNSVTVGERDEQIRDMINAVQEFWNDMDVESAMKMSEGDIVKRLDEIAATYNTDRIAITINKEQVHFERMDERG